MKITEERQQRVEDLRSKYDPLRNEEIASVVRLLNDEAGETVVTYVRQGVERSLDAAIAATYLLDRHGPISAEFLADLRNMVVNATSTWPYDEVSQKFFEIAHTLTGTADETFVDTIFDFVGGPGLELLDFDAWGRALRDNPAAARIPASVD